MKKLIPYAFVALVFFGLGYMFAIYGDYITPKPYEDSTYVQLSDGETIIFDNRPVSTPQSRSNTSSNSSSVSRQSEKTYIINRSTRKFHIPSCYSVKQMKESNKRTYVGTRDDLIKMGYSSCGNCNP